jgi:hypothetical protein
VDLAASFVVGIEDWDMKPDFGKVGARKVTAEGKVRLAAGKAVLVVEAARTLGEG